MLHVDHVFSQIRVIRFPLETLKCLTFSELLVVGSKYITFVCECFKNWLEWLEAANQKLFWKTNAPKMLRSLER